MGLLIEEFIPFDIHLEQQKNRVIKNILNVVDLAFEPEEQRSRKRDKVRKIVMDEVNELCRFVTIEMDKKNAVKPNQITR